jgi:hypothetical protein
VFDPYIKGKRIIKSYIDLGTPHQDDNTNHGGKIVTSRPRWYHVPLNIFFSTATAARTQSSHRTGDAKNTVRNNCVFTILQLSHSPFFQFNRYFWGEPASHHISSHRPNFTPPPLPPARLHFYQTATAKKRWDTIAYLQFHSSRTHHFFQFNRSFWGEPASHHISSRRPNFAPPPLPPARLHFYQTATAKKNRWETIAYLRFYSSRTHHFFHFIIVFGANPRAMISPPTDRMLPRLHCCPQAYIFIKWPLQKNGEKQSLICDFTVLALTILFSI